MVIILVFWQNWHGGKRVPFHFIIDGRYTSAWLRAQRCHLNFWRATISMLKYLFRIPQLMKWFPSDISFVEIQIFNRTSINIDKMPYVLNTHSGRLWCIHFRNHKRINTRLLRQILQQNTLCILSTLVQIIIVCGNFAVYSSLKLYLTHAWGF